MAMPSGADSLAKLARNHMTLHSKCSGGNIKPSCHHCSKTFTGSLTRQLAHLSGEAGRGIALCPLRMKFTPLFSSKYNALSVPRQGPKLAAVSVLVRQTPQVVQDDTVVCCDAFATDVTMR